MAPTPFCVLYVVKKNVDYCDIAKLVLNIYTSVFFHVLLDQQKKKVKNKKTNLKFIKNVE